MRQDKKILPPCIGEQIGNISIIEYLKTMKLINAVQAIDWLDYVDRFRYSLGLYIFVNLIPIIGVLFFHWEVFALMVLYWAENVIVGSMNVVKMATKKFLQKEDSGKSDIPFFIVHYGMFTLVHGVLVFIMFGIPKINNPQTNSLPWIWEQPGFWVAIAGLFLHHFVSYLIHFILAEEYKHQTMNYLFWAPYGRVVVLHIVTLLGGIFIAKTGEPIWALIFLVVVKIVIDLKFHIRSHQSAGTT